MGLVKLVDDLCIFLLEFLSCFANEREVGTCRSARDELRLSFESELLPILVDQSFVVIDELLLHLIRSLLTLQTVIASEVRDSVLEVIFSHYINLFLLVKWMQGLRVLYQGSFEIQVNYILLIFHFLDFMRLPNHVLDKTVIGGS